LAHDTIPKLNGALRAECTVGCGDAQRQGAHVGANGTKKGQ
jgi:hypothetical protein